VLHEAIHGRRSAFPGGTGWAAGRVRREFPQFDTGRALAGDGPVSFTGETIHRWMLQTDPALAPLRESAELPAQREQWQDLYDAGRPRYAAAGNEVTRDEMPVAAVIHHADR